MEFPERQRLDPIRWTLSMWAWRRLRTGRTIPTMPPPVRGSTSCSPADSGSRCHGRPGGRSGTTNHGSSPSPLRL